MKVISNIFKDILTNHPRQEINNLPEKNSYQNKSERSKNYVKPPHSVRYPMPEGELFDDPFKVISGMPKSDRKVLDLLIWFSRRFRVIAPTQDYIARKTGYSRRTIITVLQRLHDHKLIYKAYRHRRPCFYNISPFLLNKDNQGKLRTLFSSFKRTFVLSLSLLTSCSSLYSKTFTPFTNLRNNKEVYSLAETTILPRSVMKSGHTVLLDITKKLNLTKWGQIRLAAFHEDALKNVLDDYEFAQKYQNKKISDPFSWFFKGCLVYSNENGLDPDWVLMKKLEMNHGMPTNPVFVLPGDGNEVNIPQKGSEEKVVKRYTPSLSYKPKSLSVPEEVSAKKLYPEYVPQQRKKETTEEKKNNVLAWIKTPEAETAAKFLGKELFEKLVSQRMLEES